MRPEFQKVVLTASQFPLPMELLRVSEFRSDSAQVSRPESATEFQTAMLMVFVPELPARFRWMKVTN